MMCMTWDDFVRQSILFVAKSKSLNDSWCLRKSIGTRHKSCELISTGSIYGEGCTNSLDINETKLNTLIHGLLTEVR